MKLLSYIFIIYNSYFVTISTVLLFFLSKRHIPSQKRETYILGHEGGEPWEIWKNSDSKKNKDIKSISFSVVMINATTSSVKKWSIEMSERRNSLFWYHVNKLSTHFSLHVCW